MFAKSCTTPDETVTWFADMSYGHNEARRSKPDALSWWAVEVSEHVDRHSIDTADIKIATLVATMSADT